MPVLGVSEPPRQVGWASTVTDPVPAEVSARWLSDWCALCRCGRKGQIPYIHLPSYFEPRTANFTMYFAEVITSSTRAFEAEVYREAESPAFGSWVRVRHASGVELFGLVSHVEIGSVEPNRRAVAFGKTPDELRREMPQVLELLRTTFRAQVLAYRDTRGTLRQTLPPHPPGIHDFVAACTAEDICGLHRPFDYLRTLARNPDPAVPVDELLVAVLQQLYQAYDGGPDGTEALVEAGRVLSRLLHDDHERLQSILRRAS